jgi:glycosyltransferase involved in cell wall biosynthesis
VASSDHTSQASDAEQRIRIAAATCNLLLGGATTFLLNLVAGLRSSSAALRIIGITDRNEHASDFDRVGADLHVLANSQRIYEDRLRWGYRKIAEVQPTALLACLGAESFEMLRLAPKGVARIALIQADSREPYALAQQYSRWIDVLVGVSEKIRDNAKSLPEFAEKRVEAIPYGIDFSASPARTRTSEGEAALRVLYLGRLIEEQKRISRLAEVIRIAEEQELRVQFTVVGSGPGEEWFRNAIAGCGNVELRAPVSNRDVPEILHAQDVFLLLSDYEGLPLSLLEAMGYGLVPVVSDLPSGMREVVTPDTGMLVPIGDIPAALSALAGLAGNRDRLNALASAAEARVREKYSAQSMAKQYLTLIASMRSTRPVWAADTRIPTPLGLSPLIFNGIGRLARRLSKRVISGSS